MESLAPSPAHVEVRTVPVKVGALVELRGAGCDHLLDAHAGVLSSWTVANWSSVAACFESNNDNARAERTAARGLTYHPQSEELHNIRGYNLIAMEQYEKAVAHLRVGLQAVKPTHGVLENNLAWAGLFASDRMTLSEARRHYKSSLRRGGSCEAYHTGMWVEYAVASRSAGRSRDVALDAFRVLRAKYEPCTSRISGADRTTAYEIAGAGVLDQEIHKLTMVQLFERNEIDRGFAPLRSDLVVRSVPAMQISGKQIAAACEDIAPVRSAIPACRKALQSAMCGK